MKLKNLSLAKSTLLKAYIFGLLLPYYTIAGNPLNYETVSLCELNLNRDATAMTNSQLQTVAPAYKGFLWNSGDNNTLLWRPKGITKIPSACGEYVAVSWYGRDDAGYQDRGIRISIAKIDDMEDIKYRHILLVDENYKTLHNWKSSSLIYRNDTLYIPNAINGINTLNGFALNDLRKVPSNGLDNFYSYGYILKRSSIIHLPIEVSSLSTDWDENQLIAVQNTSNCDSCKFSPETSFAWINNGTNTIYSRFFADAQGIASKTDVESEDKILFVSAHKGMGKNSQLYLSRFSEEFVNNNLIDTTVLPFNHIQFPDGLSDLYMENNNDILWSLLEYAPAEANSQRYIFALDVNQFPIPDHNDDEENTSGIKDIQLEKIILTPNPSHSSVDFKNLTDEYLLTIYSAEGRKIEQKFISPTHHTVDMARYSKGIYQFVITNKKETKTLKFMKR